MELLSSPLNQTVIIVLGMITANLLVRIFVKRRLIGLEGHEHFVRLIWLIVAISGAAYLAVVWGLVSLVVGTITTLGALAVLIGLALVPWLSDLVVGLSLYINPMIRVGAEIEIGEVRGRIIRISLTTTQISGNEFLVIVPNRKFRDEIVKIISLKKMDRQ
jgi:small-conductance mechanosensitive channel